MCYRGMLHLLPACKDETVTLAVPRPPEHRQPDWEGRARLVFGTGRRQFVHVWSAPRSPSARLVVVPLLLLATLVVLAVGLLAMLMLLAVALVIAFVFLLIAAPLGAIRRRSGPPARRPPGT